MVRCRSPSYAPRWEKTPRARHDSADDRSTASACAKEISGIRASCSCAATADGCDRCRSSTTSRCTQLYIFCKSITFAKSITSWVIDLSRVDCDGYSPSLQPHAPWPSCREVADNYVFLHLICNCEWGPGGIKSNLRKVVELAFLTLCFEYENLALFGFFYFKVQNGQCTYFWKMIYTTKWCTCEMQLSAILQHNGFYALSAQLELMKTCLWSSTVRSEYFQRNVWRTIVILAASFCVCRQSTERPVSSQLRKLWKWVTVMSWTTLWLKLTSWLPVVITSTYCPWKKPISSKASFG